MRSELGTRLPLDKRLDVSDSMTRKRGGIGAKDEAKNRNERKPHKRKLHDKHTLGVKDKATRAQVVCGDRRPAEDTSNALGSL